MKQPKWLKKLYFQFLVTFGLNVFGIQPNFIAESVAFGLNALLISLFLKFLGIVEIFAAKNYQLS